MEVLQDHHLPCSGRFTLVNVTSMTADLLVHAHHTAPALVPHLLPNLSHPVLVKPSFGTHGTDAGAEVAHSCPRSEARAAAPSSRRSMRRGNSVLLSTSSCLLPPAPAPCGLGWGRHEDETQAQRGLAELSLLRCPGDGQGRSHLPAGRSDVLRPPSHSAHLLWLPSDP